MALSHAKIGSLTSLSAMGAGAAGLYSLGITCALSSVSWPANPKPTGMHVARMHVPHAANHERRAGLMRRCERRRKCPRAARSKDTFSPIGGP